MALLNMSTPEDVLTTRAPEVKVAAVGGDSSPGLMSVVIVCMTILAVCGFVYFMIRFYYEERRWRASARLCKCLPPASSASLAECGNSCRYIERRAVHAAVQTCPTLVDPANLMGCWTVGDVRSSEAKRSGCTFISPMTGNNEAVPNWRPPATGSSQRQTTMSSNNYYRIQKSSQRHKHRHHRQMQRRQYYTHGDRMDDDFPHYPLRRSRPVNSMMPSIHIQSPSSSDSYSILTMSHHSKSVARNNRDMTAATFSDEDEDDDVLLKRNRFSKSVLSDVHSYGSSHSYHPRYNTPVSEINNNTNMEVVVDIEGAIQSMQQQKELQQQQQQQQLQQQHNNNRMCHITDVEERLTLDNNTTIVMNDETKPDTTYVPVETADSKWFTVKRRSTSPCSFDGGGGGVGIGGCRLDADGRSASVEQPGANSRVTLVDGATQSCASSTAGWYADNLKRCQAGRTRTDSTCSANVATSSAGLHHLHPFDIGRCGLPPKGTFPSSETLPGSGGRLITRWTQTDNASVTSLDWDPYECERLRSEADVDMELADEDFGAGIADGFHRMNMDEAADGLTMTLSGLGSTTMLMADTTLQASRISHRSASSPYVICFECSEEFALNDERRTSMHSNAATANYYLPRRTSSSPHPRRLRPTTPATPPGHRDASSPPYQHHPDGQQQPQQQDGRSSKSVRPRRK